MHENIGVDGLGDSCKISDVGENEGNLLSNTAKFCRDGIVDDPPNQLFGNEVSERPYGALREVDRTAKLVNFPNARFDRLGGRLSKLLEFDGLDRYCVQGTSHATAKHPNDGNKGRTGHRCEDQSRELEPANIPGKIFLRRKQHDRGVVLLAQSELRHPEQEVSPFVVPDTSVVAVATLRSLQYCRDDAGVDVLDGRQLRLRRMRHRVDNEL